MQISHTGNHMDNYTLLGHMFICCAEAAGEMYLHSILKSIHEVKNMSLGLGVSNVTSWAS